MNTKETPIVKSMKGAFKMPDNFDYQKSVKYEVAETLRKSEQGEDLIVCEDANDVFNRLGI
jgi:hypothetical protein